MVIDIIFLIVAGYGFFIGYSRGIIKTILYTISIVFGFIIAAKFAPAATDLLITLFDNRSSMMYLAGFLLCLTLTILLIRLFAKGLEGLLKTANINVINQFLGGGLMAGLLVLLYSMLLSFGEKAHLLNDENTKDSRSYAYLKEFPGQAKRFANWVAPALEDVWDESIRFIDKMEDKSLKKDESEPHIYDIEEGSDENAEGSAR